MPLTEVKIRNARAGERAHRMWDSGGLYLEISPSGGKLWRFKYRFQGKEKLLALGKWNVVSLAEARRSRDEAKHVLSTGHDPAQIRQVAKSKAKQAASNSFETVARDWYERQSKVWVPRHAADVLRRLEANLLPDLGDRPVSQISASELLAAVRKIEGRGAFDMAHRVLQVASQVFRYGVATGRCELDPARDLRGALTPHRSKNQAAVRTEDVPRLLQAISCYDQIGDRQTTLALWVLARTFVRTGELIGAEWAEFQLEGRDPLWIIPAVRMKMRTEHLVPLARQVVAVLKELRTLAGKSRFVLPGRNPDRPISNNTMLFALYRLGYKRSMTGHGFRTIASTLLNESGFRPDVIERQLAHLERNKIRGAYNRAEYLDERRLLMQRYADMLDRLSIPDSAPHS